NTPQGAFVDEKTLHQGHEESKKAFQAFKHKKTFVQVGIGGSSLGAEMLINALNTGQDRKFLFLSNIDPDDLYQKLDHLDVKDCLFFIVSKSGSTVETLALFSIALKWLKEKDIAESEIKDYFVFCTDPKEGPLRELGQKNNILTLSIPPYIGGRFSVLTPVGLFPALMSSIDTDLLIEGALKIKEDLVGNKNPYFFSLAQRIFELKNEKNVTQTVLMPYSSKMAGLSQWFVQLWAESLGKKYSLTNNIVHQGLTPIASVGVIDQHSQMQLFIEGPKDKFLIFIEIEKFNNDFELNNSFEFKSFEQFESVSLSTLLKAELEGTMKALQKSEIPFTKISLAQLNEFNLGQLIAFLELLTVYTGQLLEINPFDQPGVEAGKNYAKQYLRENTNFYT
ncbi:MAG: glucose-6-phosphate isomerase, partial [Bacteriovoracaceae bacterium]